MAGPWFRVVSLTAPRPAGPAEQDFAGILPAALAAAGRGRPFVAGWLSRGTGSPLELITNAAVGRVPGAAAGPVIPPGPAAAGGARGDRGRGVRRPAAGGEPPSSRLQRRIFLSMFVAIRRPAGGRSAVRTPHSVHMSVHCPFTLSETPPTSAGRGTGPAQSRKGIHGGGSAAPQAESRGVARKRLTALRAYRLAGDLADHERTDD